MVMKNRVGQRASDFAYTLPSGQSYHLHELKSEYTLLLFSNPGCSTCEAVIKRLNQSKELNEALSFNTSVRTMLTILTIYPDSDLSTGANPQAPTHLVVSRVKRPSSVVSPSSICKVSL